MGFILLKATHKDTFNFAYPKGEEVLIPVMDHAKEGDLKTVKVFDTYRQATAFAKVEKLKPYLVCQIV